MNDLLRVLGVIGVLIAAIAVLTVLGLGLMFFLTIIGAMFKPT